MDCPRCQKRVKTWTDSYVENRVIVTSTLCSNCNAILKVEKKGIDERLEMLKC